MKVKAIIERVELRTGHKVYHATLPIMNSPVPIAYGEGKTKQEAIDDLNYRISDWDIIAIDEKTYIEEVIRINN